MGVAPVYSIRIGCWEHSNGPAEPFGPAVGTRWIIREVTAYNGNALSTGIDFRVGDQATLARLISHLFADSSDYYYPWSGRIVVDYPDQINWVSSSLVGSSELDVYIGGYVLSLP